MRLSGRVTLVTGASRGIGRATALTFAREGSHVIVNFIDSKEKPEEVVEQITKMGRKAIAIKADIANRDEVFKMIEVGARELGQIDVLVNNAAAVWRTPSILEATKEEWDRVLGVNLLGTYYCVQAVAPNMIKRRYGKIVNISSNASIGTVSLGQVAYAPSKAGVNILTKKLAHELGPYNINVNAIAPGAIKTEILDIIFPEEQLKKFLEEKANLAALRTLGEPQDVANLALFLASDESRFITGQVIVVDGGRFDYITHSL